MISSLLMTLAAIAWLISLFVALALVPNLARRRWVEWALSSDGDAVLGDIITRMMEPTRSDIVNEVRGAGSSLPKTLEKLVDKKLYQSAGSLASLAKSGKASTPEEASVIAIEQFLQGVGVKYPSPLLVMKTMQQAASMAKSGNLAELVSGLDLNGSALAGGTPDGPTGRP